MSVTLRPGTSGGAPSCGVICYAAFKAIAEQHHFPPAFPTPRGRNPAFVRAAGTSRFLCCRRRARGTNRGQQFYRRALDHCRHRSDHRRSSRAKSGHRPSADATCPGTGRPAALPWGPLGPGGLSCPRAGPLCQARIHRPGAISQLQAPPFARADSWICRAPSHRGGYRRQQSGMSTRPRP